MVDLMSGITRISTYSSTEAARAALARDLPADSPRWDRYWVRDRINGTETPVRPA